LNAQLSELQIYAVAKSQYDYDEALRRLDACGMYGRQIMVFDSSFQLPPLIADLVVSGKGVFKLREIIVQKSKSR